MEDSELADVEQSAKARRSLGRLRPTEAVDLMLYDPELAVGTKLEHALMLVGSERIRQDFMKTQGRFTFTCADVPGMDNYEKLACLVEEVGEVAQEALTLDGSRENRGAEGTREALRGELIQVAAVAVAWIEALL